VSEEVKNQPVNAGQAAMDLAEDSRETSWQFPSFVAELFKGSFRWDLLSPYPEQDPADKKIGDDYLIKLEECLRKNVNPGEVDRSAMLPDSAVKALADIGVFGMKIPQEYGGLGFSNMNYIRAIRLIGSYCASTAVWASAHQSIGVPQPLKLFGTKEQKQKYLPRLAKGSISAFALTEPGVGSDPAAMQTTATLSEDGKHYIINGKKLWCTNGPAAEIIVVMALTAPKIVNGKEKKQISAFIVETNTPGFKVDHVCSFLGIRGIRNGLLSFNNVKVPAENIIGNPGQGLKIAFVTLNAGRLAIPGAAAGAGRLCMNWARTWTNERVQWGSAIGKHQAVSFKLANMAAGTFAMDSVSEMTANFADHANADIRLEAAMAKYFASEISWYIADDMLQIRGGRGFETEQSLAGRGEQPIPIERMLRDLRINRIIEGTSEVMKLFIAREAMDVHFQRLMPLLSPKFNIFQKVGILAKAMVFYIGWYPRLWLYIPKGHMELHGRLRRHHIFIGQTSKKLARTLFHVMGMYQQRLEKEQLILGNFVDIGTDLFAMAASISRANSMYQKNNADTSAIEVAEYFCKCARDRIKNNFKAIRKNHNKDVNKLSRAFMKGEYAWMETGIIK
jgi:alkylation response protein AidB-like acyl-CoA dehydrogenase